MLSRSRSQIVEQRAQIALQIKSKLFQFGLIDLSNDRVMSRKYIEEVEKLNLSETANFILKQFCTIWRFLDEQLTNINKQLELQAQTDSKLEEVYRSVPGIGAVTSRVLANELGDMRNVSMIWDTAG